MVRGSSLRITELDTCGELADAPRFAAAKCVSKITVNEVTEAGSSSFLGTPEEEKRLHFVQSAQLVRHKVDIEFLRVDPGVLSLVAGVPLVYREASGAVVGGFDIGGFDTTPFDASSSVGSSGGGFGEGAFGYIPFGDGEGADLEVVGFDSTTRLKPVAFAMEVWSKLAGQRCADGSASYGYTLFPFLKGGYLSGFEFANGLVSFNLIGAQTRKNPRWGVGPYDLDGPYERLTSPVSRNTSWRQFITSTAPPAEADGIQEGSLDVIDNGTAADPMPPPSTLLVVDGGAAVTSPYIISGGRA